VTSLIFPFHIQHSIYSVGF